MEIEPSAQGLLAPLWVDGKKLKIPLYLQMEITSRCNMMCRMCYIASNCEDNRKRELSAKAWLDIAKQARDMGLTIVNITGGEPIIKEDFFELYEGLSNLGIIYTLNTNGTMMTKENVKRLASSPPFRAIVSVYGGSEETYAKVSNNGKWFDLARAGVENLLEAGINTVLRMTVVKDNLHDLQKVFDWADSLGLNLNYSHYMSPRREGDGTDPVSLRLDPGQMVQVRETMRNLYMNREAMRKQDSKEPESGDAQPEEKADEQPEKPVDQEPYRFITEDGFRCGSGQVSGFITYDGKLLPCGTTDWPSVDLREKSFTDAWPEMVKLSREVPGCAECDGCEVAKYCVPCPPKIFAESGSYQKKSPYLCEYAYLLKSYFQNSL